MLALNDNEITERIQSGDQLVWTQIQEEHGGIIYRVSLSVSRNPEVAHDVTQDVLADLWKNPERFDPTRGSLRSYLITKTRSRTLDVLRSETARSRRERNEGRAAIIDSVDIADAVADSDTAERLREVLASLPEGERDAIQLAYFGGRSYREVATELDIPEGTAKSRIRSGLSRLRAALSEAGVVPA